MAAALNYIPIQTIKAPGQKGESLCHNDLFFGERERNVVFQKCFCPHLQTFPHCDNFSGWPGVYHMAMLNPTSARAKALITTGTVESPRRQTKISVETPRGYEVKTLRSSDDKRSQSHLKRRPDPHFRFFPLASPEREAKGTPRAPGNTEPQAWVPAEPLELARTAGNVCFSGQDPESSRSWTASDFKARPSAGRTGSASDRSGTDWVRLRSRPGGSVRPPVDEVRPGGGPSVKDNPQLVARVGNSEPSQIPLPISEVPQRNRGLAQALTTTGEENIGHFLVATIRPAGTARSPRARAKHPGKTGAGPPRAAALPTGSSPTPLCVTCWREEEQRLPLNLLGRNQTQSSLPRPQPNFRDLNLGPLLTIKKGSSRLLELTAHQLEIES
ncbi:uncharacterized protein LOC111094816 isoform X1 [Canis lupus familiaris]|uniref:uncharacterized protein LOC111094816 isoform X1 n=1 Tax=Canis lupus familiaris TaxID=9615 RepID=UPI0018F79AE8|nr:uncharacterized protein LOC111094816 isoform X1 [Canis lupus familiaris]